MRSCFPFKDKANAFSTNDTVNKFADFFFSLAKTQYICNSF